MNKKIIITLTIVVIIILAGVICYMFLIGGNKQSQNQTKNSAVENIVPKSDVEVNNNKCVMAGKAYYPPKENCCDGLTTIFGSELPNGKCWCTEKDNTCGGAPICAPCGNKKCEKEYGEDKCNCPVDCE